MGALFAIAALTAALLAGGRGTVTTGSLDQLVTYLDGAYRVAAGQLPNRDFHSALGPLTFLIPGVGYLLSGSLGSAMPTGMGLTVLALAPVLAYLLVSRLHPILALSFGAFLLLVLAAPVNLGEPVTALSFSRFYNRIGWAALAMLLTMYLAPRPGEASGAIPDAFAAAFLVLVMIYTKATYGLVAFVFLAALALSGRRWAWGAIILSVLGAGIVEAVWGSAAAYLADLVLAVGASGAVRGSWGQITDHVLGNLADCTLLAVLAGLAIRQARRWLDGFFYVFCAVSGFLIINQNVQVWGILTVHAAAAVAAETLIRAPESELPRPGRRGWSLRSGAALVFLALVLPTIAQCGLALALYSGASAVRAGEALPLSHLGEVRLADLWSPSEQGEARSYLASVENGMTALRGLDRKPDRISVLGPSNPFSAALGAVPVRGDSPSLLWGRNVDARHFVPADELLRDAQIVMVPRAAEALAAQREPDAADIDPLEQLYGPYLVAHFDQVARTPYWMIFRRHGRPAARDR